VILVDRLNFLDWLSLILVIIGALNWGSIGLFDYSFVAAIFGIMTTITRAIYVLVGLAGLYIIFAAPGWTRPTRS
jgi:hypothetical protein